MLRRRTPFHPARKSRPLPPRPVQQPSLDATDTVVSPRSLAVDTDAMDYRYVNGYDITLLLLSFHRCDRTGRPCALPPVAHVVNVQTTSDIDGSSNLTGHAVPAWTR